MQINLNHKDLWMIVESLKYRLEWYHEQMRTIQDEDQRAEAVNDFAFLQALLKSMEEALERRV